MVLLLWEESLADNGVSPMSCNYKCKSWVGLSPWWRNMLSDLWGPSQADIWHPSRLCDLHLLRLMINLCQQLDSRSKSPAAALKPPAERTRRSWNPDPAEGGHGLLSVSRAACQRDIDWGSSGPWGVRGWGPSSSLNARLDWELGSSQTRSQPWAICHVPRIIPECIVPWSVAAPRGHAQCPIMFI